MHEGGHREKGGWQSVWGKEEGKISGAMMKDKGDDIFRSRIEKDLRQDKNNIKL